MKEDLSKTVVHEKKTISKLETPKKPITSAKSKVVTSSVTRTPGARISFSTKYDYNAFDENHFDLKTIESLVDQLNTVPRPSLVKCLYACHLIVDNASDAALKIVGSEGEVEKMVKILKTIFNLKNCDGKSEGLVSSIQNYIKNKP